jgi:hypothetical protein
MIRSPPLREVKRPGAYVCREVGRLALVGAGVDGAVELVVRQLAFDVGA